MDDAAAEAAEDALLRGVRAAFGAPPPLAAVLAARGEEADEEVRRIATRRARRTRPAKRTHSRRNAAPCLLVLQPC